MKSCVEPKLKYSVSVVSEGLYETERIAYETHEPHYDKTSILHMQKQRSRSALQAPLN